MSAFVIVVLRLELVKKKSRWQCISGFLLLLQVNLLAPGLKIRQISTRSNILAMYMTSFRDGAYYCYCAYILRISRYSDFLSVMLTNTGIFLRSLKLSGESRS